MIPDTHRKFLSKACDTWQRNKIVDYESKGYHILRYQYSEKKEFIIQMINNENKYGVLIYNDHISKL